MKIKSIKNKKIMTIEIMDIDTLCEYVLKINNDAEENNSNGVKRLLDITKPIKLELQKLLKHGDNMSPTKLIQWSIKTYANKASKSQLRCDYWKIRGHNINDIDVIINNYKNTNKHNSFRSKHYWINKGYTEQQSIEKVSKIQRECSKFCVEYWMKSGYTENESIDKISMYQKTLSEKSQQSPNSVFNDSSKSTFNKQYWMNRGLTESESIKKISSIAKSGSSLNYFIERYGETVGVKKYNSMIDKKRMIGERNGMFGKSSPYNSGNSISGYYNDVLFRSLYEYFFLKQNDDKNVVECDRQNSGFSIKMDNGKTYRPDFMIDGVVYEVKPKNLINESVKYKANQFIKHMKSYKYIIVTEDDILFDYHTLKNDYDNGCVIIHENKIIRFNKLMKKKLGL